VLVRYAGLAWLPRDINTLSDTLDWFTGRTHPGDLANGWAAWLAYRVICRRVRQAGPRTSTAPLVRGRRPESLLGVPMVTNATLVKITRYVSVLGCGMLAGVAVTVLVLELALRGLNGQEYPASARPGSPSSPRSSAPSFYRRW
jgi:hypothetical protein